MRDLRTETRRLFETNIIDLRILNEGLFSHFIAAITGFLTGKHSQKTVIRGQKDQIDILKNFLISMKKNQREKDELIRKLTQIQASTSNINQMRDMFRKETGINLPTL